MQVDEAAEAAGERLLQIERDPILREDLSERLDCPKCPEVVKMRLFFSV